MIPTSEEIIQGLVILPEKIAQNEKQLIDLNKDKDEKVALAKILELSIYQKIEAEKTEDKKNKYSNKEKRETELLIRKPKDENYCVAAKQIKDMMTTIELKKIALDLLKRRFRAFDAIARI